MDIGRRMKYKTNSNNKTMKSDTKIDMNFDLSALDLMCSYIVSENRNIRRSHLINMRNLFDIIDISKYQSDIEKVKRLDFIRKGLDARLVRGLTNPVLIMQYINGGLMDEPVLDVQNFAMLTSDELNWINETVSSGLKYAFIYNDIDRLIDICTRFKASDFRSRGVIVDELESLITEMQTKFRKVRVETLSEMTFTLRQQYFEEVIHDIHEQLSNPSRMLRTGMQGFNELLGGGFESSRVYMLLGLTGVGKSLTLLNLAYQIKKYNKDYRPKDPTKIPVVLYMTMENTVRETVERLFQITTGKEEIKNYSPEEVINLLQTEGELYLSDESPIDIVIKYVPNKSVDTGYLYTMVEDMEDEGYEVICLIQDHIKRIRSCYKQTDIRLELGDIVNEFKVFASIKDIPVITNSHLNRDAARTVDEGLRANKADLTRALGRSNIGESMLMLDNLDGAFIIQTDFDSEANKYMAFNRIKVRYRASERSYICQPFVKGNSIKLAEDYYLDIPLFKESLRIQPPENLSGNNVNPNQSVYINNIKQIDSIMSGEPKSMDNEDNIFSASRYTSNDPLPQVASIETIDTTTIVQPTSAYFQPLNMIDPIVKLVN